MVVVPPEVPDPPETPDVPEAPAPPDPPDVPEEPLDAAAVVAAVADVVVADDRAEATAWDGAVTAKDATVAARIPEGRSA